MQICKTQASLDGPCVCCANKPVKEFMVFVFGIKQNMALILEFLCPLKLLLSGFKVHFLAAQPSFVGFLPKK